MEEVRHQTVLDTGLQHLGTIYAKALLGATEKAGNTDAVLSELDAFVDEVLVKVPSLEAALVSPRVPVDVKERLLDAAIGGRAASELVNFTKVLARRGRFDALRAIRGSARRLLNDIRGRVEVQLTVAVPLDDATRQLILDRLRASLGREIDLRMKVDADVIGGLVIRVGDTVYDGSIANELKQLRAGLVARAGQTLRSQTDRFAVAN